MFPCVDKHCVDKYTPCPPVFTLLQLLKKQYTGQLERLRISSGKKQKRNDIFHLGRTTSKNWFDVK